MASITGSTTKAVAKKVRPLLSLDKIECRRRVISLYKAWYRQIPNIDRDYDIPVRVPDMRKKLHDEFMKNKYVDDIRVIDMLVIKGEMELKEVVEKFKQSCHIMYYFKDSVPQKRKDFISKFLDGQE